MSRFLPRRPRTIKKFKKIFAPTPILPQMLRNLYSTGKQKPAKGQTTFIDKESLL